MNDGATCDCCDREMTGRVVTLQVERRITKRFCSDSCERRWMLAEIQRTRRFLRRIWITCKDGLVSKFAGRGLNTDQQP